VVAAIELEFIGATEDRREGAPMTPSPLLALSQHFSRVRRSSLNTHNYWSFWQFCCFSSVHGIPWRPEVAVQARCSETSRESSRCVSRSTRARPRLLFC